MSERWQTCELMTQLQFAASSKEELYKEGIRNLFAAYVSESPVTAIFQ
jgi:hypothetical protein